MLPCTGLLTRQIARGRVRCTAGVGIVPDAPGAAVSWFTVSDPAVVTVLLARAAGCSVAGGAVAVAVEDATKLAAVRVCVMRNGRGEE